MRKELVLGGLVAACLIPVARAASVVGTGIVNPANGHTYYLLTADTWTNSEAAAQGLGGNLVTINDAVENQFVLDNFAQGIDVWIGYNDVATEGTFVWASGETPGYTNWRPGQPDNYAPVGGEDYGMMYGTQVAFAGKWNDAANDPSVYAGYPWVNEVADIQGVVEVAPVPAAVWGGMALLPMAWVARRVRVRGRAG